MRIALPSARRNGIFCPSVPSWIKTAPSRQALSTAGTTSDSDRLELADQLNLLFDVIGENCLNEQTSRRRVIRPHRRRQETRKDRPKAYYR